ASAAGMPALNIGSGGILFRGPAGGSTGDRLNVNNQSSNAMTIGGNVTVQGSSFHSPLAHKAGVLSYFDLSTEAADLSVNGSVLASQSGSAGVPGVQLNIVSTHATGNLTIRGSVTEIVSGTKSGPVTNVVNAQDGDITIGLGLVQIGTGTGSGTPVT